MKILLTSLLLATAAAVAGPAAADSITFYQDDNFRGRHFSADRPVENFSRNGFNDQIRSAVVHDGRWEICVDADFGGSCSVLAPGAYPDLGAYAGRVSSVRPVDGRQYDGSNNNRADDRGRGRSARATLFEGPNLSGRSWSVNNTMTNLGATGFNDRASSLRVENGYWIFCSDADFQGDCRTFGPGDYPSLPGMNNVISSGRRITNDYPYQGKPDWQRNSYNR
jgi:hypothetical protein